MSNIIPFPGDNTSRYLRQFNRNLNKPDPTMSVSTQAIQLDDYRNKPVIDHNPWMDAYQLYKYQTYSLEYDETLHGLFLADEPDSRLTTSIKWAEDLVDRFNKRVEAAIKSVKTED